MEPSRAQGLLSDSSEEEIPIYLKVMKTVAVKVKPTETVKSFKALLREKRIVSENIQDLFFSGQLINDSRRLVDHGIERNSTLHLVLRDWDGMKLFVKIPSEERTILVEARAYDTVQSIKSLIQVTAGIESDRFSLVYEGKLLEEDRPLCSANVKNESTLSLVFCQKDVLSIYVKALSTGEVVKLKVKVTFTVADVKAIVMSMLGASVASLFYSGQHLEDSKILACYDIKEESMLELSPATFQIFVKTWSGNTIALSVLQTNTVKDLKEMIFHRLKIPIKLQSIIFAGKRLEDGRHLDSYNIQKDCTLCMVLAPSSFTELRKLSDLIPPATSLHDLTVHVLKLMIRSTKGIKVKEVLFNKVPLLDDFYLEQYQIDMHATLAIVY